MFRVLSIDGGGYLGLATASLIRGLEDHFKVAFSEVFDLFCGTSTGAIISLGLASGKSGAQLTSIYKEMGCSVFDRAPGLSLRQLFKSKYESTKLRAILEEQFGDLTFASLRDRDKSALVTAYCLTQGRPRIFKTDHAPQLTQHGQYRLADVALASAAAPLYFPMVRLDTPLDGTPECFCDGGVTTNHPALLGFVEALSSFGASPGTVKVLSLSTPRAKINEVDCHIGRLNRGLLQWKKTLPSAFMDSGSLLTHEVLRRLTSTYPEPRPCYERIHMDNDGRLALDDVSKSATQMLEQLGTQMACLGSTRSQVLRVLGN